MADDREHTPAPEHAEETEDEVREGLETAQEVIEGVSRGAEMAQQMAEGGGGTGEIDAMGALQGTGAALGVADQVAGLAGADPAVRTVLAVGQQAAGIAAAAYEAGEALVEAGEAIIEAITGEAEQHRVDYEFECEAQSDAGWRIREIEIDEELNRPYRARLLLVTDDVDALPNDLLGQDCRIRIKRGEDTSRSVHGLISRVEHGQRSERHLTTTVEVVPALDVLRHVRDSRIFQNLTSLEVIDALVGVSLQQYGRELRIDATAKYLKREYCVQYQESVLDFFHRLCEDEGLTYFFEQSGEHETLVIVDDNASYAPCYLLTTAADVPFVAHRGGDIARAEPVYALTAADQLGPTSLTLADFDWTADTLPFSGDQRSRDARDRDREQYEHGGTVSADYDESGRRYTTHDLKYRIERGRERQALTTFEYRGDGAVTGFTVGTVFTLSGHPEPALDGEYLLIAVRHRGRDMHAGDAAQDGDGENELEYANEFVCIPSSVPHRPSQRTSKPRVHGIQTALVVGPSNEEIWTDVHGRIRVQFHWDRVGRNDQDSTCWVRVMQSWAGAGFGTMFIPRIGMEVVVTFLDGDPDRPLVTGCVYNANNVPPITLPDDKTQSVVRTKSSMNSDGFNELRFEDKAGSERVYLHAQKDLAEEVEHDHSTHVKRNQSNTVDATQRETIGQDQHLHVKGDRYKTVDKDEDVHVIGNRNTRVDVDATDHIRENQTTKIGGREHKEVKHERNLLVNGPVTEQLIGGRNCLISKHDVLHVKQNRSVTVDKQLNISATEHFKVQRGDTQLYLKDVGYLSAPGKVQIVSTGNKVEIGAATELKIVCGAASITLKSNGEVTISGPNKVTVGSGGSNSVETAPTGVTVKGARIESNATGTHTIAGALVRIN
ncbi:type VI secretion system Vgr family protein [Sandaracinus amylolyticus]|uniref:type VI secretion system Vgr family protein n=1 Tax=Sandaracinus amylolyticus TaxID=927083 RepID=UPI001F3EA008|nr:type VI secretion system tip protein TssI/VgrG [Sandaracinus amylolyticus]UJR78597.1 Type VI secretion system tip protein VgrG [Sandaracinus amylolyticus]